MASRSDKIIDDAIRRTANRRSGTGGDAGYSPAPMTGVEAIRTAQKAFNAWLVDEAYPWSKDLSKVKERAEILDGVRSRKAAGRAAVRYEDLRALERFPTRPPNYRYLGAAPSADDYNKLAADVKKLYEVIGTLASMLDSKS